MKTRRCPFIVLLVLIPLLAHAQEVVLPPVNLGDTSFLDGVPGPGLLVEVTVQSYRANRLKDPKGRSIPGKTP